MSATDSECLVCGETGPDALQGWHAQWLACRRCGAVNDLVHGYAPVEPAVDGGPLQRRELRPGPVALPTPPGVIMRAVKRSEVTSPYRRASDDSATIIARWGGARSRVMMWAPVGLAALALGLALGSLGGWMVAFPVLLAAYLNVAHGLARWELRVEGEQVELRRRGLPVPPGPWLGTDGVRTEAIARTRPRHVQIVSHRFSISAGEELRYFGFGVVDERGRRREYAISTDLGFVRFLYQLMLGNAPQ